MQRFRVVYYTMEYPTSYLYFLGRAVFTWLSKGIGFGFGFGFTTPFGWLVYLLWFWFYDSQVKTALYTEALVVNHKTSLAKTEYNINLPSAKTMIFICI